MAIVMAASISARAPGSSMLLLAKSVWVMSGETPVDAEGRAGFPPEAFRQRAGGVRTSVTAETASPPASSMRVTGTPPARARPRKFASDGAGYAAGQP